jgi:hypothetical protein
VPALLLPRHRGANAAVTLSSRPSQGTPSR